MMETKEIPICERCHKKDAEGVRRISMHGYEAYLCWKCTADFDNAVGEVVMEFLH